MLNTLYYSFEKQHESIAETLSVIMKHYRITKYDPSNRNEQGHYLYDHWTEFGDIGRTLEGELVTVEKYLSVEQDYVNAIIEILRENKVDHLRVVGHDKKRLQESIKENKEKWFHRIEFDNIDLFEDTKISLEEVAIICQMNFRNYCNISLEVKDLFFVHFGYDMYVYIGVTEITEELKSKLNKTQIFIEDCYSPYYSDHFQYVIQRSKKRSKSVLDEEIIKNTSVDQMKKIMDLSNEHPGRIYSKLNNKIATQLNLQVDFEKYDYFITSEDINE